MVFDSNEEMLDKRSQAPIQPIPAIQKHKKDRKLGVKVQKDTVVDIIEKPRKNNLTREKGKTKGSSILPRIFIIGLAIIVLGSTGYLVFLYLEVNNFSTPDVPSEQLTYDYSGVKRTYVDEYLYPPQNNIEFKRIGAYEKERTEYRFKIIPLQLKERTYYNYIDQNAREPPFIGQFHMGAFKTLGEMDMNDATYHSQGRFDEIMSYQGFTDITNVEKKTYEHDINSQKVNYYEYEGKVVTGISEGDRGKGEVKAVMLIWTNPEEGTGCYFVGFSITRLDIQANALEPDTIEDTTTWDKIISLMPRIGINDQA